MVTKKYTGYSTYYSVIIILFLTTSTLRTDPCPLEENRCDVQFHVGGAPTKWINRGGIYGPMCPIVSEMPVAVLNKALSFPPFHDFYHTPWTIGAQGGYSITPNVRLFLEFDYSQAHAKCPDDTRFVLLASSGAPAGTTLNFTVNHYRFWEFSLGADYYFDRIFCDRLSFFTGAKAGIMGYRCVKFNLSENIGGDPNFFLDLIPASSNRALFIKSIVPLAALQIGCDCIIDDHWNIALTAEFVGSAGPKSNEVVMLMPSIPIPVTHALIGHVYTQVFFPITASVRYSF